MAETGSRDLRLISDWLLQEWDRVESGIDDLLSLRTAYWEPGLGPRAPRRSGGEYRYDAASAAGAASRGRSGLLEEREDSAANLLLLDTEAEAGPSSPQLDQLMHQAMAAVNNILANLEADKGEQQTATSAAAVLRIISPCADGPMTARGAFLGITAARVCSTPRTATPGPRNISCSCCSAPS